MSKPTCINLLERYGDEFKVGFDPAYSAAGVPRSKLDPHYMRIECLKGIIFVHDDTRLVSEVEGRRDTRTKLRNLDCVEIVQDGDTFLAVTFDVANFDKVAAVSRLHWLPGYRVVVIHSEVDRLHVRSTRDQGYGGVFEEQKNEHLAFASRSSGKIEEMDHKHPRLHARIAVVSMNGTPKTNNERLWPGRWAEQRHGAKMVKKDLQAARTAWIEESGTPQEREQRDDTDFLRYKDEDGRYFDFHALRSLFITALAHSGAHLKEMQMLARHSRIELTLKHYTKLGLREINNAVQRLPGLPQPDEAVAAQG